LFASCRSCVVHSPACLFTVALGSVRLPVAGRPKHAGGVLELAFWPRPGPWATWAVPGRGWFWQGGSRGALWLGYVSITLGPEGGGPPEGGVLRVGCPAAGCADGGCYACCLALGSSRVGVLCRVVLGRVVCFVLSCRPVSLCCRPGRCACFVRSSSCLGAGLPLFVADLACVPVSVLDLLVGRPTSFCCRPGVRSRFFDLCRLFAVLSC